MTEYAMIFDYQTTATVFSYLTVGFMVAYGLVLFGLATSAKTAATGTPQHA